VISTRLLQWSTTPARLRGMALCRIFLGLAGIDFYMSSMAQRNLLWGPNGYIDARMFRIEAQAEHLHTIYSLSNNPVVFQVLFFCGLSIAAVFTVFGGRTLTVAHAVFLWSLYLRNGQILDGGDNLASILVILLAFVVTDAYYSPLADRRRSKIRERAREGRASIGVLVHNSAVLLVTFQIAILYFCAGAWKVAGPLWQDGTAMYYVNRTAEFRFLSLGWLTTNPLTTTAVTWYAMVANLGFPFALLVKRHRAVGVAMAMAMHIGIIVVMGLTGFGITMIGADLGCISDEEYAGIEQTIRRAFGRLIAAAGRHHDLCDPSAPHPGYEEPSPTGDGLVDIDHSADLTSSRSMAQPSAISSLDGANISTHIPTNEGFPCPQTSSM
jgi:hypothetical protein